MHQEQTIGETLQEEELADADGHDLLVRHKVARPTITAKPPAHPTPSVLVQVEAKAGAVPPPLDSIKLPNVKATIWEDESHLIQRSDVPKAAWTILLKLRSAGDIYECKDIRI